jgi:hypothetical protein
MRLAGHVSEAPGQYIELKILWLSLDTILNRFAIKFKISLNIFGFCVCSCLRMPDDTITEHSASL